MKEQEEKSNSAPSKPEPEPETPPPKQKENTNKETPSVEEPESPKTETGESGKSPPTIQVNGAENVEAAQYIKKIKNFFAPVDFTRQQKPFSLSGHSIQLSLQDIANAQQLLVYPGEKLEQMATILRNKRMLLLTGLQESGRFYIATYLVGRIKCELSENLEIRFVKPLSENVLIDLQELITQKQKLKNLILIFRDAFAKKNKMILNFFTSYSKEQSASIIQKLSQSQVFIIFTVEKKVSREDHFANFEFKHEVTDIDKTLLEKGYHRKLKQVCLKKSIDLDLAVKKLESRTGDILEKLGKMSKIHLLIDQYLNQIMDCEDSDVLIDRAISEVNDIKKRVGRWFRRQLDEKKQDHFDAWTGAICLALFGEISFADFATLHDEVTRHLLRKLYPYHKMETFDYNTSDTLLLEQCQAEITKGTGLQSDTVEFCDPRYREALLEILLNGYRKVLLLLIPIFKKCIGSARHYKLRQYAAAALAAIGLISPEEILLPIIREWEDQQDNILRTGVGYLYDGILLTENKLYKNYYLAHLRYLALSNNLDIQWTAIAAFKQIGLRDIEFAMEELMRIYEKIINSFIKISKTQSMYEFIFKTTGLIADEEEQINLHFLHQKTDNLLSTIHYSLVALCILKNPFDVFVELQKWFDSEDIDTRWTMVAFVLGEDGLLHMLEQRYITYFPDEESDDKNYRDINILLYSLSNITDAVTHLAEFLKILFEKGFRDFKSEDRPALKKILLKHIENWVIEAIPDAELRDAMENFIVEFSNTVSVNMRDSLYSSMREWQAPDHEEKLVQFRKNVRNRLFNLKKKKEIANE